MLKKIGEGAFLVSAFLMTAVMCLQLVELLRYILSQFTNRSLVPLLGGNYTDHFVTSGIILAVLMVICTLAVLPICRESPGQKK